MKSLKLPLKSYVVREHFKLYLPDIGLMRFKSDFPLEYIALDAKSSIESNGAISETYMLQELTMIFKNINYWAEKHSDIDFVFQYRGKLLPVEVKYGTNVRSSSLKKVLNENEDLIDVRYSGRNFKLDGRVLNIPLYMVSQTKRL